MIHLSALQTGWPWNITGNSQNLLTAHFFRWNNEIFLTRILCKHITFVSSFMQQTKYLHVFRGKLDETLTFCEIKFGYKNTPAP